MKVLDYYKKYLNSDVKQVKSMFINMNYSGDTSGMEFYDVVIHESGEIEYFFATFMPSHSLVPCKVPKEWLDIADIDDDDTDIPDEAIANVLAGRGY